MIHALKIKPEYFKAVANLDKLFEVRKADRPFRVGDYIALNEIDDCGVYTGAHILARISYILDYPAYLQEGYVVLGLTSNGVIIHTERYTDLEVKE